jgi:O-antigen ligase
MNIFDKFTIGFIISAAILSAALFGVWEEKMLLCAPLLVLVYLAAALWICGKWKVGRAKWRSEGSESLREVEEPTSNIQHSTAHSIPPGGGMLLLFWLYSLALIPFSALPYEAKVSVLIFGGYLAVYWASANILSRFSYRKAVWTAVLILMVIIALYSLVQHRVAPNLIYGIERYTDTWVDGRLGGTYQCPNHIAHLFQMWLPLCLVFLFIPQFGWFWRICFAYALPLFLLLIYQTQSRAGILGSVAAIGVTLLLMVLRKSRKAFLIALLAAPLLFAGMLGGLWAGSAMFRERMQPVAGFLAQCSSGNFEFTDSRPQAWLDTLPMIADRPVFGFGPGNYGQIYEEYRKRVLAVRVEMVHAHNEYLELLAEYGLVGGVLVLCVLISVSVQMIRLIRTSPRPYHALPAAALLGALAGTAVHGFFDFELHIFPNAMMLALLAGCTVAPVVRQRLEIRGQRSEVSGQKSAGTVLTSVLRLLISILLLLAAGWSVQVMSSSWIRARGDKFLTEQNFKRAEIFYKTAERIDPQNWLAQLGLGQVYYYYRYNELDPARKHERALKEHSAYAEAYRINNKKEEVVYGLGRVELFLGNRDKGLAHLRQAANYKRFNDFYWRKLGIELRKAGLYEEALTVFEYARTLDSSNPTVKRNIEWLKKRKAAAK